MGRANRRNCTFRQRDLAAALRAAKQTGHEVSQIVIDPDGHIRITTGAAAEPAAAEPAPVNMLVELAKKRP